MIILSSQADVNFGDGMGTFGKVMTGLFDGDPSNSYQGVPGRNKATDLALGVLSKISGNTGESGANFDPNFVDSGKQLVPGGSISGGKIPPLENGNVREVYNQTPQASILIKKRAFSSLSSLYVPALMDPDELWLFRATKKLFASKCSQVADVERLTKISKLVDQGVSTASLVTNLVSSVSNDLIGDLATSKNAGDKIGSFALGSFIMEQIARARSPVNISTWFQDQTLPAIEEIGFGTGVFELTNIVNFSTSLNIGGDGTFNLSIEDPYSTMFITEGDIETAIRDTVLSGLINIANKSAGLALSSAQSADNKLSESRTRRNVGQISFSMSIGNEPAVTATIDTTGYNLTPDNLDNVESPHELSNTERSLFNSAYSNLTSYANLSKKTLTSGTLSFNKHKKNVEYVRNNMRFAYLGKNIIQPMDKVHIFVDSGTRKSGEEVDVSGENRNILDFDGAVNMASSLGPDETGIDESLLKVEWELSGKQLPFAQFKKIASTYNSGIQVISGLVKSVTDSFNEGGLNTIAVQGVTEMEWLRLSQYNAKPSLDQTQGILFDPLTPFDFETDVATGLPIGRPRLTQANIDRLSGKAQLYAHNGPLTGTGKIEVVDDLTRDIRNINGSNMALADHVPGLIYKWKEGIITATYNMSTANKFDQSKTSAEQLRRDVGFFWTNTAFDNMDVANILSVLITGQPYNYISFLDSAVRSGTYIPDATLNDSRDYFSVLQDVQGTINDVQGNFTPFKSSTITRKELAKMVLTKQKLGSQAGELTQLRREFAKLTDRKYSFQSPYSKKEAKQNTPNRVAAELSGNLEVKIKNIEDRLKVAENELVASNNDNSLSDNVSVYGNDVTFNYDSNVDDKNQAKLFGDNLIHATLKRKEDVIYNRDKTYFIVSDEYDKDYDVQAFSLGLKKQAPAMWESNWEKVYDLCKKAVDILNFEFFVNTQGHIEFRPPQYNRTPLTVFEAIINYGQQTGANLLPDFLKKLFDNREVSLINQVIEYEWRIRLKASLLGATKDIKDVHELLKSQGHDIQFISVNKNIVQAVNRDVAIDPGNKKILLSRIQKENDSISKSNLGLFNPQAQYNLQSSKVKTIFSSDSADPKKKLKDFGNEAAYKEAVGELSKITGKPTNLFEDFSKVKVGVSRSGIITPATDIAKIVSDIAKFVSQRSNTMRSLERVLQQRRDIGEISSTGGWNFTTGGIRQALNNPDGLFGRLIEDNSRNTLGHLSKERFVIMDKDVKTSTFTEEAPKFTTVKVTGTDPIVGEGNGNIAGGVPLYTAYGTDFDTWRQYGWRSTQPFDRPFFWSAELQCAPYAKMLLSRARRNIVHGSLKVRGNEFYQLGDVVFYNERQLLFYVEGVSHTFDYNSGLFDTSLTLKYGHPPGVYIPSPLDIIGKNLSNKTGSQTSFRVRRERSRVDRLLGVVKFDSGKPNDLLGGTNGARNQSVLQRAASIAQQSIDPSKPTTSQRLYIMGFGSSSQDTQINAVKKWFSSPQQNPPPSMPTGTDITGPSSSKFVVDPKMIKTEKINQTIDLSKLSASERDLIKQGIVANNESWLLDKTLETVVEIRLRPVPIKGWQD